MLGLPWAQLGSCDAVFFTAGDLDALRAARAARVLVASPRAYDALGHGVRIDALVLSAKDEVERREAAGAESDADAGRIDRRRARRLVAHARRRARSLERCCGAGRAGRLIRLRRLVRRGSDLRARRRHEPARRACARRALRGGVPNRARALRAPVERTAGLTPRRGFVRKSSASAADHTEGSFCTSDSTGANRSPRSAIRSSTWRASKRSASGSPPSSAARTSSHCSGVETVGRSVARSE